jgi:Protein of unknown function (DUF3768)
MTTSSTNGQCHLPSTLFTAETFKTIAVYDDFCYANDPHEEHDFGAFEADGQVIFFKIEYYDRSLTYHSEDPC